MTTPRAVLTVCTGNLCRSPLAEVLLRRALQAAGVSDVSVSSAGMYPAHGLALPDATLAAAARRGLDLTAHVPRALDLDELARAELVLCASRRHRARVLALLGPGGMDQRRADAGEPCVGGGDLRVRLMHDALDDTRGLDVPDPYGCDDGTHELVAALLERAMNAWAEQLAADS